MARIAVPLCAADVIMVDTGCKPTSAQYKAMIAAAAPKRLAIWRTTFFGMPKPDSIDKPELDMALELGAIVLLYRNVPYQGWKASSPLGTDHAQAAVANAMRAGYVTPDGAAQPLSFGQDMEGLGNPGLASYSYACSSAAVYFAARHGPVQYNGFDCGMTSDQCDAMNASAPCGGDALCWWCDFAALPTPATKDRARPLPSKGYAGHQKPQGTLAGFPVDEDTLLVDGVLVGLAEGDVYVPVVDPVAGATS